MEIRPVQSEADYAFALSEIDRLMDARLGSPDGVMLDALVTLVEAWERRHAPIDPPDPIAAIEFRMDQMGLARKDLEPIIGSRGRVSEILSGRRSLTLSMIRRLHGSLGIPAEVLIGDPAPPSRPAGE
mgnify:CR=1 FL=1